MKTRIYYKRPSSSRPTTEKEEEEKKGQAYILGSWEKAGKEKSLPVVLG